MAQPKKFFANENFAFFDMKKFILEKFDFSELFIVEQSFTEFSPVEHIFSG